MFGSGYYCVLGLLFGSGYYCVLGLSVWFWLLLCVGIKCFVLVIIVCWDLMFGSGYYCVLGFNVLF